MADRLLTSKDLANEFGIRYHRTTISRRIRAGTFPKPLKMGGKRGRSYWKESQIQKWLQDYDIDDVEQIGDASIWD